MIAVFGGEFPTYINKAHVTMVRDNKNSTWIHMLDGSIHKVSREAMSLDEVLTTLGWTLPDMGRATWGNTRM